MFTSYYNFTKRVNKKTKFILFVFLLLNVNLAFSQKIGQGQLLDEESLEQAIISNLKRGVNKNENIFINHYFSLDITEKKVTDQQLIESIKGLKGVLDVNLTNDMLIIVTGKENNLLPSIKQHLSNINIRLISKREQIYKI